MPRSWRLFAVLLAPTAVADSARAAEYTIGESRIDVSVRPEKLTIILGEPSWIVFRIAKVSGADFTFTRDIFEGPAGTADIPSYRIVIRGPDGAAVGQPLRPMGRSYSGPGPRPFTVTAAAPYEYRVFLPAWAVFEKPGDYTINLRRALAVQRDALGNAPEWALLEAVARLRVDAPDPDQAGRIIDDLGGTMLRSVNRDGFEPALAALSQIDDERVIPYFRQLIQSPLARSNSARGFQPLAKFDTEEALQLLKAGLDAMPAEAPGNPAPADAQRYADNMRRSAARALMQSRHPRAIDVLLTHIDDPLSDVRQSVMTALATQPPEKALPYLNRLSGDPFQWIASESRRYADSMAKPGYTVPAPGGGPRVVRRGDQVAVRYDARPADLALFTDTRGVVGLTFTREQTGPLTYLTEQDLAAIERWPDLKSVEIGPIPMCDGSLAHLAGIRTLREVDLSDTAITDRTLDVFAALPDISTLRVRNTKITAEGVAKLAGLKRLTTLDIWGTPAAKQPESVKKLLPQVIIIQ